MSSNPEKLILDIEKYLKNEIHQRPSFFQLQYFVINKEPTHQSKMWQCLHELKARRDDIFTINLETEETKDQKELMVIEMHRIKAADLAGIDELDRKAREIEIRIKQRRIEAFDRNLNDLDKRLKDKLEEATFFLKAFKALEEIEALKPFDDPEVQQEYWNEKLSQELNLTMLLKSPLSTELVKMVLQLNDKAPIKKEVIKIIEKVQKTELNKIGNKQTGYENG